MDKKIELIQMHPFPPEFSENSRILILGTFPSVKSRENQFYYGHPNNRFWKVMAEIFKSELPISIEDKKIFLANNNIALWDVIKSCTIEGSSDSKIRDVVPNDISEIFQKANIEKIFTNGKLAKNLYDKYMKEICGKEAISLPSTSPANAAYSLSRLTEIWRENLCSK